MLHEWLSVSLALYLRQKIAVMMIQSWNNDVERFVAIDKVPLMSWVWINNVRTGRHAIRKII